jgi:hypothetical protein
VPPSTRAKQAVVPELQQRVHLVRAFQSDIATLAAVSATRSATRNELLAAESYTTISAWAAGNVDFGFINEHARCTAPSFL